MKKQLFMLLAIMVLILGACGTSGDEVETASESSEPRNEESDTEETEDVEEEEDADEVLTDEEETLVDEDKYSMKLVKVERKGLDGDEQIKVTFDVENKSDDYLEFYARSASADGKMIPDEYMNMYIDISPGKEATDSFEIIKFEEDTDFELPELNEELEIDIMVTDEDWEYEDEQTITIEF